MISLCIFGADSPISSFIMDFSAIPVDLSDFDDLRDAHASK